MLFHRIKLIVRRNRWFCAPRMLGGRFFPPQAGSGGRQISPLPWQNPPLVVQNGSHFQQNGFVVPQKHSVPVQKGPFPRQNGPAQRRSGLHARIRPCRVRAGGSAQAQARSVPAPSRFVVHRDGSVVRQNFPLPPLNGPEPAPARCSARRCPHDPLPHLPCRTGTRPPTTREPSGVRRHLPQAQRHPPNAQTPP